VPFVTIISLRRKEPTVSTTGFEAALYGSRWEHIHQGYFSDPELAAPLVKAVLGAFSAGRPDVVADLGGGTGFLLGQLVERCGTGAACFINVDDSAMQLADTPDAILCLPCQIQDMTRRDLLLDDGGRLMFCMRSLLHYFGREGLRPALRHLRRQMRPGEFFVHQTACFEEPRPQGVLNLLYQDMGTDKWYPLVEELRQTLDGTGWRVKEISPAPCLALTRHELEERYRVEEKTMDVIESRIIERYGSIAGTFEPSSEGFTAYLHYSIVTCQAI
jgi:SAM-dependent methyltransferase